VSWRWERIAAWLFVPYAAWLAFALSLNAGIVLLNR
jgi:tryptophan-rich sensory protein